MSEGDTVRNSLKLAQAEGSFRLVDATPHCGGTDLPRSFLLQTF